MENKMQDTLLSAEASTPPPPTQLPRIWKHPRDICSEKNINQLINWKLIHVLSNI